MEPTRTRVSFEEALEHFHQDYTVVVEFIEPGETRWYVSYAFNKKEYHNEMPEKIPFGEYSKATWFVLGLDGEQLKLDI